MWCITEITWQYRERMYRLCDLYAMGYDPLYPVVCMDEKSKQLIEDSRGTIPMRPGSPEKYDYEYKRNGTRNIFMAVEPLAGKRIIKVTQSRKRADFAHYVRDLADHDYYSGAKQIKLVVDNLNTHNPTSIYQTFKKREANRILKKIIFVYTPKHGSWLNMAEIEINIMDRECLNRRMANEETLTKELNSWAQKRNENNKKIAWKFTRQDADAKLSKHYVA